MAMHLPVLENSRSTPHPGLRGLWKYYRRMLDLLRDSARGRRKQEPRSGRPSSLQGMESEPVRLNDASPSAISFRRDPTEFAVALKRIRSYWIARSAKQLVVVDLAHA